MSLLRGQTCRGRSRYSCDFLAVFVQVVCMLAPVFLAPGKPPEGTCRMFLTFHTDPVRSLPGLGLPCNTWARVRGKARGLSHLSADPDPSRNGYHKSAMNIITATWKIIHCIKTKIPELYILGNPPV